MKIRTNFQRAIAEAVGSMIALAIFIYILYLIIEAVK